MSPRAPFPVPARLRSMAPRHLGSCLLLLVGMLVPLPSCARQAATVPRVVSVTTPDVDLVRACYRVVRNLGVGIDSGMVLKFLPRVPRADTVIRRIIIPEGTPRTPPSWGDSAIFHIPEMTRDTLVRPPDTSLVVGDDRRMIVEKVGPVRVIRGGLTVIAQHGDTLRGRAFRSTTYPEQNRPFLAVRTMCPDHTPSR